MNLLCSRCNKRPAIVFVSTNNPETGNIENQGLCIRCAKELNIPGIDKMVEGLGISPEELEQLEDNMSGMLGDMDEGFEIGGAAQLPEMLSKLFAGLEGDDSSSSELTSLPSEEEDSLEEPRIIGNKNAKKEKKEKKQARKFLDNYCENLTTKARENKLDRIIGRDKELYRVIQILNRRSKNNPCLIGEPGVGKTAIAEGLAQKFVAGDVPRHLAEKEIYLLDLTSLLAGTQFRGQFESRVKGLIQDIKEAGNVILFIDEVHNLVGAGDSEGSMNAANILKPALSRGEIQIIGATTFNEYRKHIEKDAALERRFQPVTINEPSIAEATEVLKGIKNYYEMFHRVKVSDEIIERAVVMSERYITDRYLPDKAIDLLDEACSCSSLENKELQNYDDLNARLKALEDMETEPPLNSEGQPDYELIANNKMELAKIKEDIIILEKTALNREVTLEDLARVIELWTSIPASKIKEAEFSKVAGLEGVLKEKIIGQDEAVELVSTAIRRTRVSLSPNKRPASFIFVGPTGVGKTELVKVLSKELFDSPEPLIRLDMSEYMEKHAVSKIIGSPPGYVGYDEAGQLTEKIRRRPYSVVLFDEIEKAHPDVMNILLQILDEGKITDAHGRQVSFENTVIVMTSNAGSHIKESSLGFAKSTEEISSEKARKALSEFLRPEFIARVDEIVVFRPLDEKDYAMIASLMLEEFKVSLDTHGIKFGFDDKATAYIGKKAFGNKAGARDIRRIVRREVEDALTLKIVSGEKFTLASLTSENDEIKLITA